MTETLKVNPFIAEVVELFCADDRLLCILVNALKFGGSDRIAHEQRIAYSLKLLHIYLLTYQEKSKIDEEEGQDNKKQPIAVTGAQRKRIYDLLTSAELSKSLATLKDSEKELVKSIDIIESLITSLRNYLSRDDNQTTLATTILSSKGERGGDGEGG